MPTLSAIKGNITSNYGTKCFYYINTMMMSLAVHWCLQQLVIIVFYVESVAMQ